MADTLINYYYDGGWHTQGPPFEKIQRGFCYGDGIFETMRVADGHILLFDLHAKRAFDSGESIELFVSNFTKDYFQNALALKHEFTDGTLRWYQVRGSSYGYTISSYQDPYIFLSFDPKLFIPKAKPVTVFVNHWSQPPNWYTSGKTLNGLYYIVPGLYPFRDGEIALITDEDNTWMELQNACLYIVDIENKHILTPHTSVLHARESVTQQVILAECNSYGYRSTQSYTIKKEDVPTGSVLLATNVNTFYHITHVDGQKYGDLPTWLEEDILKMAYL